MKLKNVEVRDTEWGKASGLMFSIKKNLLFVFNKPQKVSFHNFFVFFSIDLVFLDKNMKILEIKRNFKPFRIYTPKNKASYVLELCEYHKLKIGEKVELY